jgi:hypothetical protein
MSSSTKHLSLTKDIITNIYVNRMAGSDRSTGEMWKSQSMWLPSVASVQCNLCHYFNHWIIFCMEAGYNTSIVALQVVEAGAWGYNWATVSLQDINTETWSSKLGVGCKADDLALWKKLLLQNPKKRKPDGLIHDTARSRQIWQNLLRKPMTQKTPFCFWWWRIIA